MFDTVQTKGIASAGRLYRTRLYDVYVNINNELNSDLYTRFCYLQLSYQQHHKQDNTVTSLTTPDFRCIDGETPNDVCTVC